MAMLAGLMGCTPAQHMVDTPAISADLNAWSNSVTVQAAQLNEQRAAAPHQATDSPAATARSSMALAELYRIGLAGNHQINVARQQVRVADAEVFNAAMRFFPTLNGTVTRSGTYQNILDSDNVVFQQGEASYGTTTAGLDARLPIFNLENIFNYRKIEVGQRKAYVDYIGSAQTYIRDLIVAYIDLAEANAIIAEYEEMVRLLSNSARTERERAASGTGSAEIALSFEQQLSDVQSHLVADKARRQNVLMRIYDLTGQHIGGVQGQVSLASLALPASNINDMTALALRNNPRYMAKTYELAMFDEEVRRSAAADFAPRVDAYGSYEYEDRGGSQFGGGSETVQGIVGVRLSMPLFNPNGSGYQTVTANARNSQIAAELAMVRREIETALNMAHSNFLISRQRMEADSRTLARGSDIIQLVNQRLDSGGATVQEGLQTRLDQASFQRQRAQAQFQMLREWVTIKYLVGSLSEADVAIFSGSR